MAFRLASLLLFAGAVVGQQGVYQQCGGIGWQVVSYDCAHYTLTHGFAGPVAPPVSLARCAQRSMTVCVEFTLSYDWDGIHSSYT